MGLVLIGIIMGASFYYSAKSRHQPIFTTDIVRRGDLENVVLTSGVLYPSKLVSVGAQVSGLVEKISVQLGDEIKEGDPIAQIDNLTQKNALKEAQAKLDSINAQYRAKLAQIKGAKSEFKRKKQMLVDGATSQAEYDTAESTLAVYNADLDRLKAEKKQAIISVDNAKLDLGYTNIEAPSDGTVIYVSVEEGQTVNTNQSTPTIIELAKLDVMTVKAQVSEADIIHVKAGQEVYFTILGATGKKFKGVLRAIEPGPTLLSGDDSELNIGDDDAIYYNALFDVENPDKLLRIGMTAQVSIVLESAQDALIIPSQVLVEKEEGEHGYCVPVKRGDMIEYRDIDVGMNNKIYVQILSGLSEGEEIIIGKSQLSDEEESTSSSLFGMSTQGMGQAGGPPPAGGH